MSLAIWEIGGPCDYGENNKAVIARAAGRAGISVRMARALFYRESPNPGGRVVDTVRAAKARINAERAQQEKLREETGRAKAERAFDRLARSIDAALQSPDADEVRGLLVELRGRVARMRGLDRAMAGDGARDDGGRK